jgi:chromosome segregation ATPase
MAIFGKRKKDRVVDLSGRLERHRERMRESASSNVKPDSSGTLDLSSSSNSYGTSSSSESSSSEGSESSSSGGGFFGSFFGGGSSSSSSNSTETALSESEEKRKRLAKRIASMTEKIEELENEVFRLKQRMDVLEKKQRLDY